MRRYVFVVNPKAGMGRAAEAAGKIQSVCRERGLDFDLLYTERPAHATELVLALPEDGQERLVCACGGDGTLNEVAAAASKRPDIVITHIPYGTGNDLIRLYGDDAPRFAALDCLADTDEQWFDAIDTNTRFSLNMCSMGFDARAASAMTHYRFTYAINKKLPYNLGIVTSLLGGLNRRLAVHVDGKETFEGDFALAAVMNGRYYGGGFMPAPDALPDDGLLDLVLVSKVNVLQLTKLIGHYSAGNHAALGDLLIYRRCRTVEIESPKPTPATFDGEIERIKSLKAAVRPKCVRFAIPKGATVAKTKEKVSMS